MSIVLSIVLSIVTAFTYGLHALLLQEPAKKRARTTQGQQTGDTHAEARRAFAQAVDASVSWTGECFFTAARQCCKPQ